MDIMGPAIQASCYDGKYQSKALDQKVSFDFLLTNLFKPKNI